MGDEGVTWRFRQQKIDLCVKLAFCAVAGIATVVLAEPLVVMGHSNISELLPVIVNFVLNLSSLGFVLFGAFFITLGLWSAAESRRIFRKGPSSRGFMYAAVRASVFQKNWLYSRARYAIYFSVGALGFVLFSDYRWLSFSAFALGVTFWLLVKLTNPPFVVLLSTSAEHKLALHLKLKSICSPLRVVAMLDMVDQYEATQKFDSLAFDCVRTVNHDDWRPVIEMILRSAILVVVDLDANTPGVEWEVDFLRRSNMLDKVAFVGCQPQQIYKVYPDLEKIADSVLEVGWNQLLIVIAGLLAPR